MSEPGRTSEIILSNSFKSGIQNHSQRREVTWPKPHSHRVTELGLEFKVTDPGTIVLCLSLFIWLMSGSSASLMRQSNAGTSLPSPPSLSNNRQVLSKAKSVSFLNALALPEGPKEGRNLAQRPLEFLRHSKEIASIDSSFICLFWTGEEDAKAGRKEQKISGRRAPQGLGTSSERHINILP